MSIFALAKNWLKEFYTTPPFGIDVDGRSDD
jgi:hypothetical protein